MENLDAGNASVETVATESHVENSPAPEAVEAKSEPVAFGSEAHDAKLMAIYDKHIPPRSDDGKFAPKADGEVEAAKSPEAEEQVSVQPETKAEEPAKPAIEPPHSWTAEKKAQWAALPPDVQEYVAQRESEQHRQISQLGSKAKAAEPLLQITEQHRDLFEKHNLTPEQGYLSLLNAQRKLEANPVSAIAELATMYGVDLTRFAQAVNEGHVRQPDPEVIRLRQELASLRSEQNARKQQESEQRYRSVETEIEAFSQSKPDWSAVENDVLVQVYAIKAANPDMDPKAILEKAYETARYANPTVRARILEDQRRADEEQRRKQAEAKAKEAKKLAPLNVNSKSGANPGTSRSMDEIMRSVAAKHYGNASL